MSRLREGTRKRKRAVKITKVMDWWQTKIVFPVRRVLVAVSARVKARNKGAGLLKLRDDIQTCGYEDVQVMWEMLRKTETELISQSRKRSKHRLLWRFFERYNSNGVASFSTNAQ